MTPRRIAAAGIAGQAAFMAEAGARGVYVTDSAGASLPDGVRVRIAAMRDRLGPMVALGVHAHGSRSLAANTLAAIDEAATLVDSCLGGLAAGAGNTRTGVAVAVLDERGIEAGLDLCALQDLADDVVRPLGTPAAEKAVR